MSGARVVSLVPSATETLLDRFWWGVRTPDALARRRRRLAAWSPG